jgi:hypothetical protein
MAFSWSRSFSLKREAKCAAGGATRKFLFASQADGCPVAMVTVSATLPVDYGFIPHISFGKNWSGVGVK